MAFVALAVRPSRSPRSPGSFPCCTDRRLSAYLDALRWQASDDVRRQDTDSVSVAASPRVALRQTAFARGPRKMRRGSSSDSVGLGRDCSRGARVQLSRG